ncbi:MAG: hypothetical protein IJZ04_01540 [Clostridia bacterium]|nr:hypothetical protein [Clostridia bacterium]
MGKKYLRKNEFRVCTHPDVISPRGDTHVVYVSAKHGHKAKVNVITHSLTFFNEPTIKMRKNPNIVSKDPRPSRFSVPRWYSDKTIEKKPEKGVWRLHKVDKIAIKKFNKKYANNYKK